MREIITKIAELEINIYIGNDGKIGADVFGPDGRHADIKINVFTKPSDLSDREIYSSGQWIDCNVYED